MLYDHLVRHISCFVFMIFAGHVSYSQSIFELNNTYSDTKQLAEVSAADYYTIDVDALEKKINSSSEVQISLPTKNAKPYTLLLEQTNILSADYRLILSSGKNPKDKNQYAFFQGTIKEVPGSKVSLTLVNEELHLFFTDNQGNYEMHPFENDTYSGYYEKNLLKKNNENWDCIVKEVTEKFELQTKSNTVDDNCVSVFYEVDQAQYNKKGQSAANTEAWLLAVLNQVAVLYMEHDIPLNVSGIQVWDTPDPYLSASNTSDALNIFRSEASQNPNNNGRLAHLISGRSLGGGIAYVNTLCASTVNVAVSANMTSGNTSYPNYSWNVMVIAHELGHNFGSRHTHACVWNGNNTAIDGCATTQGNCDQPAIPPTGGTIMSYCHTKSVGINFNHGFGPQPGALIKNKYETATCITGTNCAIVPPFNDYCSRAKTIPVLNQCANGTYYNHGATNTFSEGFTCGETGPEKDVWFSFEYPVVTSVKIELSQFEADLTDMVIEVYKGSCSAPVSIGCSTMDSGVGASITIEDSTLQGETLYVRVVDKNSDESGKFNLCIYAEELPCPAQKASLVDFYTNLAGAQWINQDGWDLGATSDACDYCSWYGVGCDRLGNVVSLNMSGNNLAGTLTNFSGLESVIELHLDNNILSGKIPADLMHLTELQVLNLSNNSLTDTLPEVFGDLASIRELYVDHNNLSGELPEGLGYNSSFRSFSASNNNFHGCFTNGLSSFCYKDSLNLSNNPIAVRLKIAMMVMKQYIQVRMRLIVTGKTMIVMEMLMRYLTLDLMFGLVQPRVELGMIL